MGEAVQFHWKNLDNSFSYKGQGQLVDVKGKKKGCENKAEEEGYLGQGLNDLNAIGDW